MNGSKGFAITSMVIGIISLMFAIGCLGFASYVILPAVVIGLALGIISLVQRRAGFYMAVSGTMMCAITTILSVSFISYLFVKYGIDTNLNALADMLYGRLDVDWYLYLALGLASVSLIVMIIIIFIRRKTKK